MTETDQYIINGLKYLSEEGKKELMRILGVESVKQKRVSKKTVLKNCSTGNKYN